MNTLATSDTFFLQKVSNASKSLPWALPSFLRNKKDALVHCLHILDAASSNIKANWGLIINSSSCFVDFIYLWQFILWPVVCHLSKQIISSGMIRLEKQREKKPVIKHVSGHTKWWWCTVNPWHEHTWLLYELTLLMQPQEPWQVICDHFSRDVHLNHGLCEPAKKKASHLP